MGSANANRCGSPRKAAPGPTRRSGVLIGRLGLVVAALVVTGGYLLVAGSVASASHHKGSAHHSTKHKAPCLVGKWTVTNFTLNAGGVTASGGAGTEVDISSNQGVVGRFTPGAPLTSGTGTLKFTGTDYGKYGFSTKSTAKSGTFPVTYTTASDVMLSVNGAPPTPAGHTATTGSYVCAGKDLTLTFPAGGNEITYALVPSK